MTIHILKHPRTLRVWAGLTVVALAIGLPFAIDWVAEQPALIHGSAYASVGAKVAVTEPVLLTPTLPLVLERGSLSSIGQVGISSTDLISRLEVEAATFRLPLSIESGVPQAAIVDGLAPLVAQLANLNFNQLAIRRSRLDFVGANGWISTLTDLSLDVSLSRKGALQIRGTAQFRGQTLKIDLSGNLPIAEPRPTLGRRIAVPIKLSVKSGLIDADFEGRMIVGEGLKLSGDADIRARKLRGLARWFGLHVPTGSDLKDASIVGPLDWGDGILAFKKATVAVDGNRGDGAILLRLGGVRPTLDGTLNFKTFNLAPHLAAQMMRDATPPARSAGWQYSIASAFDADLRLSAAKVSIHGVETGRAATTLTLRSGRMQAELAELEIEGGTASGQATLDVNGDVPRLVVKGKLVGVDPGRVFVDFLQRNPLTGRADIVLDGVGQGFALPDMIADFSGKAQLAIPAGGRLGLDLRALAYGAHKARHVGWSSAGKGVTLFDQLDAKLQISKGAVTIEDAKAKTAGAVVMSSGKVDLPGRLLDLTVQLMATTPDTKAAPADVLVFRGSWADPAISLQGRPFTLPAPAAQGATIVAPALTPSSPRP